MRIGVANDHSLAGALGACMIMIDNAVSALLMDLRERGMEQDVMVIVWGLLPRIVGVLDFFL